MVGAPGRGRASRHCRGAARVHAQQRPVLAHRVSRRHCRRRNCACLRRFQLSQGQTGGRFARSCLENRALPSRRTHPAVQRARSAACGRAGGDIPSAARGRRPPLGPESGITHEETPDRAVLRADKRGGTEAPNYLWLLAAGWPASPHPSVNVLMVAAEPFGDPLQTALVSALVLAARPLGTLPLRNVAAVLPAEVTIDTRITCAIADRSVQTADVIEVASADVIDIVTPRRSSRFLPASARRRPRRACVAGELPARHRPSRSSRLQRTSHQTFFRLSCSS